MSLYENWQWAVTDYGLVSVKPGAPYEYEIAAKRLLETANHGETIYDWPIRLAEKNWVDLDSFLEAYTKALEIHEGKYIGPVDPKMMAASILLAKQAAGGALACPKDPKANAAPPT